jgi:C-terminal processing protease CtpA/Prc
VTLTIDRDGEIMELEITREKIIIKDVEYEMLDNKTFYIQIRNF